MDNLQENLNIVPSGYRILFTFFTIFNSSLSQKELNIKLNENPHIDKTFTKEAIIKFINTLKASDIEIKKENNKYHINKLPWTIDISESSLNTLIELRNFVKSLHQEELEKEYNNFIDNLLKYIPEEDCPTLHNNELFNSPYSQHSSLIKKLESLQKSGQKIIINSNSNKNYQFDNFKLEYHNKNVYLTGYSIKSNENKTLNLTEIKRAKLAPQKAQGMIFPPTVIFKLKARLANGYKLKPNEKLISKNHNELIISNKGEDKKILLRRLLKYKNLCEILSPESVKRDFKELLNSCLANY